MSMFQQINDISPYIAMNAIGKDDFIPIRSLLPRWLFQYLWNKRDVLGFALKMVLGPKNQGKKKTNPADKSAKELKTPDSKEHQELLQPAL